MNSNKKTVGIDRKVIFSTLWIFVLLNYIYGDIFNLFFNPEAQSGTMTAGAVFAFAVLMETAIAMVILSRVLKYGANRWANIIVGAINTAAVFFLTFLGGTSPAPFSVFFATIEIVCTLVIIWYAWKWPNPQG